MIRIEEMSVRLGMSFGDPGLAQGTKKGRAVARPYGRRRGPSPARGLFRPESSAREGEPVPASTAAMQASTKPIVRPIVGFRSARFGQPRMPANSGNSRLEDLVAWFAASMVVTA